MSIWKNGIMGVVVGDALGCPVQFESREEVARHPVTGMRGYGTFNLPAGSWTDDSSLALALLESIKRNGGIDYTDIMDNFVKWLDDGEFTPYGYAYDIGRGTMNAIRKYKRDHKPHEAGSTTENNNGNGSLMRIMPRCCIALKGLSRQMKRSALFTGLADLPTGTSGPKSPVASTTSWRQLSYPIMVRCQSVCRKGWGLALPSMKPILQTVKSWHTMNG